MHAIAWQQRKGFLLFFFVKHLTKIMISRDFRLQQYNRGWKVPPLVILILERNENQNK